MRKILLLFGLLFLYSCAVLQYEKTYLINQPHTLVTSRFFQSLVFLDSNKVAIQTDGLVEETPAESMGKWRKKGNKITIKSDLQPDSDSASNPTYRKVEKKLNTTRSLDTVYIYALDTAANYLACNPIFLQGANETSFEVDIAEYLLSCMDTVGWKLQPYADVVAKIPKSLFYQFSGFTAHQDYFFITYDRDFITTFGYTILPIDTQYNEFYFELKTADEFCLYAYADWTYYLWPDGRLCSRTYGYYRKIKFRRFIRKAFPFTKKWFPKQFKYVDFFGHCLLCQNEK